MGLRRRLAAGRPGPTVTHRYATAGTYTATLEVRPGRGERRPEHPHRRRQPPAGAEHRQPGRRQAVRVGEAITLPGSATDPEDGTLADSALTWEVVKHHATHTHPFLPPTTGNDVSITAPSPEDFASTTNSYLEIRLTATDSRGLSQPRSRRTCDRRSSTLRSPPNPAGLRLELNGATAPPSLTSWKGWELELDAPDPQWDAADQGQTFVSWSDGGAQRHTITTPASAHHLHRALHHRVRAARRRRAAAGAAGARIPAMRERPTAPTARRSTQPSCRPAVQASAYTTVGTPDANGFPARSTGSARFTVLRGEPTTPANEADVRIEVSITDVLDRTAGRGLLRRQTCRAVIDAAITDRPSNAPASDSATATGSRSPVDMPCIPDSRHRRQHLQRRHDHERAHARIRARGGTRDLAARAGAGARRRRGR